jgi:GNAT superfamily N-acetyltransferase
MGSVGDHDLYVPETATPLALDPSSLPSGDSEELVLVQATELERTQCWHLNVHAWRGLLSPAQYLQREVYLERQSLVSDGKITFWFLTLKNYRQTDKSSARPILASCETLLKEAYVAQAGQLRPALAHGIGSVFCRPEYRGKGYASRMMSELATRLGKLAWQQPREASRGHFSVLYSDVGPLFYAKHGWKPMSSNHITLAPIDQVAYDDARHRLNLPPVEDLRSSELEPICQTAIMQVESELVAKSSKDAGERSYVAISPDYKHITWHFAREDFLASTLHNAYPEVKGAVDRKTGCALIWSRVFRDTPQQNGLDILKTVIPSPHNATAERTPDIDNSIAALLLRAQLEAKVWDMQAGVEVWNPEKVTLRAAKMLANEEDVKIITRKDEHICSLRWEGEGEAEWISNDKYAWC